MLCGNHSCLFPVRAAVSEDPRRNSICCQQVICLVSCQHYVFRLVVRNFVEGGFSVGVVAAFFYLVGVLWVGFSRVFVWFAVGVVGVRRRRRRRRSQHVWRAFPFFELSPSSALFTASLSVLLSSSMFPRRGGGLLSPLRKRAVACPSVGVLVSSTPVDGLSKLSTHS